MSAESRHGSSGGKTNPSTVSTGSREGCPQLHTHHQLDWVPSALLMQRIPWLPPSPLVASAFLTTVALAKVVRRKNQRAARATYGLDSHLCEAHIGFQLPAIGGRIELPPDHQRAGRVSLHLNAAAFGHVPGAWSHQMRSGTLPAFLSQADSSRSVSRKCLRGGVKA